MRKAAGTVLAALLGLFIVASVGTVMALIFSFLDWIGYDNSMKVFGAVLMLVLISSGYMAGTMFLPEIQEKLLNRLFGRSKI